MHITKIEPQKKRPGRSNVFVDGEFAVGVSNETLMRFGLRLGDEIGPERLKALEATEELLGAKRAALRFLSYRPRTVKEIRDKLREKEFGEEEIDQTINGMQEIGLLNDDEFARMFIRNALTLKPVGRMLLQRKLLLLGIAKSTVTNALDAEFRDVSQEVAALEVAQRFMRKSRSSHIRQDVNKQRSRLAAFLSRRGFSWDVITPILNRLITKNITEEAE